MRRLLSILIVFCMLFNTALGYTLTVNGVQLTGVDEGRTVEIYAPEKSGYSFTGWEVNSGESVTFDDVTSRTTSFVMPEGNTSIVPVYTPVPTTTPTGEPTPSTTPTGEPTPSTTPTGEPTPSTTPTGEPTPSTTYTVSYDANGGSGAPSSQEKTEGVDLTLSSTVPTYTGYIFTGWNTAQNGSGTSYASGATYSTDADAMLYAQWIIPPTLVAGSTFNSALGTSVTSITFGDKDDYTSETWYDWDGVGATDLSAANDGSIQLFMNGTDAYVLCEGGYFKANSECSSMFNGMSSLTAINNLDNVNTSNVTDMVWMFYGCSSLTSLDLSNFNTSNVTNMYAMFSNCGSLTSLDVSNFNTSNVTNMDCMFDGCSSLTSLDLSNFDTSNVTHMTGMFRACSVLTSLNVSNFDTSNVTDMSSIFDGCSVLTSLDVSSFDTSSATDMSRMFFGCSSLTSLDLSNFNTSSVTSMGTMFSGCNSLTSLDVSSFDTSSITDMEDMFLNCRGLTSLDLSNFNTSSVTSMSYMFFGCISLTSLDVSNFDTSSITDMGGMFSGCSGLTTIYVSNLFVVTQVTESEGMFLDSTNLVGGNNTSYSSSHVDATYAVIDTASTPGYFTRGYTIKYDANGGEGAPSMQTKAAGVAMPIPTVTPTRTGYTFTNWNTVADGSGTSYASGATYSTDAAATLYAQWQRTPNAPVLATGLTPVNWSGSAWVTTTEENWDYNYTQASTWSNSVGSSSYGVEGDGTAKWANAQTADGSMYVWIPRYTYKIVSGEHASVTSWSSDTSSSTVGKILVIYSDGVSDDNNNNYLSHSAFKFGDDELEGIWVAKFESSRSDATASSGGTSTTPASKPGVKSWASVTVSQAYDSAYNLNRNLDSHLLRNSEWSAVAYLTNAVGRIPYRNNNNKYITGIAGDTENAGAEDSTTNSYSTEKGVRGSTTHNIYGIYDMNAGLAEMVSTYYSGGTSTYLADDIANKTYAGSLYANRNTKYVEVYDEIYDENVVDQAMYAISASGSGNTSWDSDKSVDLDVDNPVLLRGGHQGTTAANSGIFYFYPVTGAVTTSRGFRVAFAIADEYNIYYDGNGADSAEIPSQTKAYGANATISSTIPTRNGYIFYGWNTQVDGSGTWYNAGATYSNNSSVTLYAQWQFAPNAPVLGTGMTPLNWNGSTWVTTTESNWDYNYNVATANTGTVAGDGTAKWANAQTSDGSMYVWIPRYTYKIESGYHLSGITSWNSDSYVEDTSAEGRILIKFSNGVEDDTGDDYLSHPAFTFGADELEGIWVAKYEASRNDATSSSAGSGTTVSSKPGVIGWDNLSVSAQYDNAYNMNRALDSHLMRNSEWGAVAYLTNAIGRMPYMNANTSYITGYAGTSSAWNTVDGVKASTTHNIYGIYDMAGGRNEAVAAYYTGGTTTTYLSSDTSNKAYGGSLYTNRKTKYVELYNTLDSDSRAYSANNPGDAVYEVSGSSSGYTAWDGAKSLAIRENNPLIVRSGPNSEVKSSIFHFTNTTGEAGTRGFRPVLAVTSTLKQGSDFNTAINSNVTSITFGKYDDYSSVGTWGSGTDVSSLGNKSIQMFTSGTNVYVLSKSTINLNEDCSNMFSGLTNLETINGMTKVHSNRTTNMSGMFNGCSSLTQLDLTNFNTSSVTNMSNMFNGCSSLVKVAVMPTIFVTTSVSSSTNMFNNCTNIIGPKGTTYSSSHIDKTYAVLDGTTPGYFWGRSVTTLELGKYVTYASNKSSFSTDTSKTGAASAQTFNPSTTNEWRVLTNGLAPQLIPQKAVKDTSSKGLTIKGKSGYRFLVSYLNTICGKYVDSNYAVSGRSLGSTDKSVKSIAASYVAWNTGDFTGRQDTYYSTDEKALKAAGITGTVVAWIASRYYNRTDNVRDDYQGRTMTKSGTKSTDDLYRINQYGTEVYESATHPIYPVVTLRDDVYITGGSGTSDAPYTIGYSNVVVYDANGGSGVPTPQIKTTDVDLTLSSVVPTRAGYTFTGWNTKADGSGTSYASGATYSTNSAETLYAQWNVYTVIYSANGGSGAPSFQLKTLGTNLTLSNTKPVYSGKTFKGWNTAADGSGTSYAKGATYSVDASVKLYAQWQ